MKAYQKLSLCTLLLMGLTTQPVSFAAKSTDTGVKHAVTNEQISSPLEVGKPAPELSLVDQAGKPVKLADFKGKYVYINFWASWCEPCLEEMPQLNQLYQKYKDHPKFVFLAVASAKDAKFKNPMAVDDTAAAISKTAQKQGATYPILFDQGGMTFNNYMVQAFPTHVLIDPTGKLERVDIGEVPVDLLAKEIEKRIKK